MGVGRGRERNFTRSNPRRLVAQELTYAGHMRKHRKQRGTEETRPHGKLWILTPPYKETTGEVPFTCIYYQQGVVSRSLLLQSYA